MSPDDYILDIKTRFGEQSTKDGQLIRDLEDRDLLRRMIQRWPGDREKIIGLETYLSEDEIPPALPPTEAQTTVEKLTGGLANAFRNRVDKANQAQESDQSFVSKALQTVGQGAGFVGDVAFEGIKAITPEYIKEDVAGAAQEIGGSAPVQAALEGYNAWKEAHPEAAGNLEAVVNIGGLIPGAAGAVKGTQLAGKGVQVGAGAVRSGAEAVGGLAVKNPAQVAAKQSADAMGVAVIGPQGKKATISALERSGSPGGYAPDDSFWGRISGNEKYVPTAKDKEIAESVAGIVSKKNAPSQNIANIKNKVSEVSETVVRPALLANPMPFNVATYAKKLKDIEMPDFIKADETLARTYEMVRNRFVEVAKRHPKTKAGLWEARKEIDDVIEQQFGAAGFNPDKYSALQKAMLDMRRATNDFIADGVPDDVFRKEMRRLSNMYSARHNIALDNYALQNKDAFTRWTLNNPKKWTALKAAGLAGVIGTGGLILVP